MANWHSQLLFHETELHGTSLLPLPSTQLLTYTCFLHFPECDKRKCRSVLTTHINQESFKHYTCAHTTSLSEDFHRMFQPTLHSAHPVTHLSDGGRLCPTNLCCNLSMPLMVTQTSLYHVSTLRLHTLVTSAFSHLDTSHLVRRNSLCRLNCPRCLPSPRPPVFAHLTT